MKIKDLVILLVIVCGWHPFEVLASRPNIVLFVSDDHGLEAGAYGNKVIQTPHLDALAADGTRFNYAFATTASCSASRSVLLTGLHNHANGQYGHEHSFHNFHTFNWVKSLPVMLENGGYRTGHIGKFHIQPRTVYRFQEWLGGNPGGSRNPVSMAEQCREFIQEEGPFFLYFCTSDPHRGGGAASEMPHAPDWFGNHRKYEGVKEVIYNPAQVIVPPFLPDIPETRAELAQYYQSVSRIDQGIGRLVKVLQEAGRYHNTVFIYLSDNGIAFPGAKTTIYEPGLRLPLIARVPTQKQRGGENNAMVSWADITPTILELAGLDLEDILAGARTGFQEPYRFHGRSFLKVLEEKDPEGWDEIVASHTFHEVTMYYPMRAIRTRDFKYILNLASALPFPFASDLYASATWQGVIQRGLTHYGGKRVVDYLQRPRHELYHMGRDPYETENLAEEPEFQEVLGELQERLRRFQEQTNDPWVVKYRYE
jgi:N-sulfoglucosamine sulfohydrolase